MTNIEFKEYVVEMLRVCHTTIEESLGNVGTQIFGEIYMNMVSDSVDQEMCEYVKTYYNIPEKDGDKFFDTWVSDMDSDDFVKKFHDCIIDHEVDRRILVANIFKWRNAYLSIFENIFDALGLEKTYIFDAGVLENVEQAMLALVKKAYRVPSSARIEKLRDLKSDMESDWTETEQDPMKFAEKWGMEFLD